MTTLNGFVKLHRKMIGWGWYSDCVVKDVFLHILMVATFKPAQYLGYELKPGQAVIGLKKLSIELGFSIQQIRTALKKLESTGEISLFSTNRFTIATVENWEFYQGDDDCFNKQDLNCEGIVNNDFHNSKNGQKSTSKSTSCMPCNSNGFDEVPTNESTNEQQTSNKQITNKQQHLKNVKNVKNVKKVNNNNNKPIRHRYGEFDHVMLSDEDMQKLQEEFPEDWPERIRNLDEYIECSGKSYKNHLLTIRTWARRDEQKQSKGKQKEYDAIADFLKGD